MLKNISNLGKPLNKAEQQAINGGKHRCNIDGVCPPGNCCVNGSFCMPLTHPRCNLLVLD